jgi:ATP-binding cassette subfamily G (WHITE) protein 2
MRFNGRAYNKAILKSMSAYVMQDDLLHAELTVAETLSYASELRLPQLTDEERTFREEEVLALMNIEHTKDVIIGDTRRKGISGGERKRVCIAVELLTRPKLFFWTSPPRAWTPPHRSRSSPRSRGSPTTASARWCPTILQPQKKIFDLFDNLILMKKGRIVYQGSCQKVLIFLASIGSPGTLAHRSVQSSSILICVRRRRGLRQERRQGGAWVWTCLWVRTKTSSPRSSRCGSGVSSSAS